MAGIPNSGVAEKIREIDEQESHWKSDTMVVDTNLEDDTMASNHNSGAEEKIRDVRDKESNWMSDWRKSERIRKIERSLVIYGGQNGGQAEQNGGRAEQNGGRAKQNGGQSEQNGGQVKVLIMKLTACRRKPDEQYTPEQWQFGLHNRDVVP
ncbi:unnamed protein product [Sphagnum jensenii]|uniref:Uncharacterized protein n=1 Tax=Sphagnum jensenii TaxID=128206 RepID=A0ABP0WUU1_9BRYO